MPECPVGLDFRPRYRNSNRPVNNGIKLAVLVCILCYVGLRWMVRRVWYQKEHARPGYFRHMFIIRSADWFAWIFLGAAFFLMVNVSWKRALLMTAGLVGYDTFLHWFFLRLEARRICKQTPGWTMPEAKRRLRQRVEREISG